MKAEEKMEVSAKVNTEENEEVNIIDKSQSGGMFELFRLDFDALRARWY